MSEKLKVLQAALLSGDVIYTMARPARHGDIMRRVDWRGTPDEQGFLLTDGSFATRERAWEVAQAAGQPILRHPKVQCGPYLFSEDLW